MDLEIAVYFMPRLSCTRASHAATLRKVTNGIIENQYLRSVLTIVPSPSPLCRLHSRATIAVTSCSGRLLRPFIRAACSKSFGHAWRIPLYIHIYTYIYVMRFAESPYLSRAVIAIELREHSFSSARSFLLPILQAFFRFPPSYLHSLVVVFLAIPRS